MTVPAAALPAELLDTVVAAATAAAERLPAADPLVAGQPGTDVTDTSLLPADATSAVTCRLSGAVQGEAVIVVAAELVTALAESPLGALELAPAVQPAFEAACATLGQVVVDQGRELAPELALDALQSVGAVVVVPLLATPAGAVAGAAPEVRATFALALTASTSASGKPAATIPSARRAAGLELLRDVEMEVTAELGRTRMTVRELLSLAPGAVVELDRMAGSPADVLVNGTLLARGEVVVVDEDFGIRITEIVVEGGEAAAEVSATDQSGAAT